MYMVSCLLLFSPLRCDESYVNRYFEAFQLMNLFLFYTQISERYLGLRVFPHSNCSSLVDAIPRKTWCKSFWPFYCESIQFESTRVAAVGSVVKSGTIFSAQQRGSHGV